MDLKNIPGTAHNIYENNPDIKEVYDNFRNCYMSLFSIDPIKQKSMFTAPAMRSVECFVRDYGKDDAIKIVSYIYGEWGGRFKNKPIGKELFSKKFRWLTDSALAESNTKEVDQDIWL